MLLLLLCCDVVHCSFKVNSLVIIVRICHNGKHFTGSMLISRDVLRCFTFKEMPDMVSLVNTGNVQPNTLLDSQHSHAGI